MVLLCFARAHWSNCGIGRTWVFEILNLRFDLAQHVRVNLEGRCTQTCVVMCFTPTEQIDY